MSLTCEIGSNVDSVGKVQAEYDSSLLIGCAATFTLLVLLDEVIASKDAAQDTSQPRLPLNQYVAKVVRHMGRGHTNTQNTTIPHQIFWYTLGRPTSNFQYSVSKDSFAARRSV
jgi:hypothetical protein